MLCPGCNVTQTLKQLVPCFRFYCWMFTRIFAIFKLPAALQYLNAQWRGCCVKLWAKVGRDEDLSFHWFWFKLVSGRIYIFWLYWNWKQLLKENWKTVLFPIHMHFFILTGSNALNIQCITKVSTPLTFLKIFKYIFS